MQTSLLDVLDRISAGIWGPPMLTIIAASGVYLTIKTRFFQFKNLGKCIASAFSSDKAQGVTPFQSACTALSATMGTGNIAGVAGAVAIGGPGAVFWMWVSAFLCMAVKFSEIVLAVIYREKKKGGNMGGPMYYIKNGLPSSFAPLGVAFALLGLCAVFGTGNLTQINTLVSAVDTAFSSMLPSGISVVALRLATGIAAAIICAVVLIGGASRIGRFNERLVPLMTVLYFILCTGVIIYNIEALPKVIISVFKGAFAPRSATGGVVGSALMVIRTGAARGVFSNESGLGTAPMAYACSDSDDAIKLGMMGIFEVFTDTIVVCTLTAVAVLCAGTVSYGTDEGTRFVMNAFSQVFGQGINSVFCIVVCFFAFSSVIGWGLYGILCSQFIFGARSRIPFLVCFCSACIIGALAGSGTVWKISEILNGLMVLPNIVAVILLSPRVQSLLE